MSTNPVSALSGIEQAVQKAGGRRALAKALSARETGKRQMRLHGKRTDEQIENAKGVTEQAVAQWVANGWVPEYRVAEIADLYGIDPRLLLKPSLVAMLYPV